MSDELTAYFREAASWDIDRAAQTVKRERIAWLIAATAGLCVFALGTAVALMMPLKTVQPYVIRVDNSTGIVDIVPMYAGHAEIGETVARYLLTHYVTVCEGFSFATAERDYEECGAYHTAKRNQEWYALWNQTSPASPLNLNRDGSVVRVQVTAVTFFRKANGVSELAQVRDLKGPIRTRFASFRVAASSSCASPLRLVLRIDVDGVKDCLRGTGRASRPWVTSMRRRSRRRWPAASSWDEFIDCCLEPRPQLLQWPCRRE